jgi:ABC-2 type transport system permease protein
MLLQYRAAAIAGITTQIFWGFIRVMIFEAFYRSTTVTQPMAFEDVVTYVWLGQAFLAIIPWNIDAEIRDMVRNGTVAYEMLRPLDFYNLWFFRALASRTAPALLRSIPIFILGTAFLHMQAPDSLASGIAFAFAMVGAVLLSAAISTIMNISLLWTISGEGATRVVAAAVTIFSGMVIPLPLFPDWAQKILQFLPFAGLIDTPFRLYTGNIASDQAICMLLHQAFWIVALIHIGRLMLARGVKIMVVQGG